MSARLASGATGPLAASMAANVEGSNCCHDGGVPSEATSGICFAALSGSTSSHMYLHGTHMKPVLSSNKS